MSAYKTLPIALGDRAYDVLVGQDILIQALPRLAELCPNGKAFIAADTQALSHHSERLHQTLSEAGIEPVLFPMDGGETIKSWDGLKALVEAMLTAGMERVDPLIAFGGGTVGDLAGLAASMIKRGTGFIQIPTTLLAQVDSSVGGKTAINTAQGKNLAGAFYQPRLVIADTAFLETLPDREMSAGMAEIIKAGAIGDAALFEKLEKLGPEMLKAEHWPELVADSIAFKAKIVAADEREHGQRALLNLGHTFAHAFEAEARSGELLHGEAVAYGLVLAHAYSQRLGHCAEGTADRIAKLNRTAGLPSRSAELPGGPYDPAALLARMGHDKKNIGGKITLVLSRGIANAYIETNVVSEDVLDFLSQTLHDH